MPSTNGHGPNSDVGKVALYLRVSSDEQRERESIKTQREFFEQYCKLYELEVTETYADDGVSGTMPVQERPEGRWLLEDARVRKFDTVLVYRIDRLGRSLLVIVDAHDRLQVAGSSLRSATEPIDTSNPSGRLIFQMLASFAEYERETIGLEDLIHLHQYAPVAPHVLPVADAVEGVLLQRVLVTEPVGLAVYRDLHAQSSEPVKEPPVELCDWQVVHGEGE